MAENWEKYDGKTRTLKDSLTARKDRVRGGRKDSSTISARDKHFVDVWAAGGFQNASEALREAGGSGSAQSVLAKPEVSAYLREVQGRITGSSILSAEYVVKGFMDIAGNSKNDGARVQALDRLAKIVGLFDSDMNPFLQAKGAGRVGDGLEAYDEATLREVEAVLNSAPKLEKIN